MVVKPQLLDHPIFSKPRPLLPLMKTFSRWTHFFASETEQDTPHFQNDPFWHTVEQQATMHLINLMKLVFDINAPTYSFQLILKWVQLVSAERGFDFSPSRGTTRTRNIDWMFQMTENAEMRFPYVVPVHLSPGGSVAEVVCFDFVTRALSILQDRSIMKQEREPLSCWNDPCAMHVPPGGVLGEALSGSVYQNNFH